MKTKLATHRLYSIDDEFAAGCGDIISGLAGTGMMELGKALIYNIKAEGSLLRSRLHTIMDQSWIIIRQLDSIAKAQAEVDEEGYSMKVTRVIAIVVALMLMSSIVAFAGIDWASMDSETIEAEISNALIELANRGMYMDTEPTAQAESDKPQKPNTAKNSETRTGKATLMDAEGVTVVASTFEVLNDPYQIYKPALKVIYVVENTSSKNFEAHLDKTSINDWEVDHIGYIDIDAGNKAKGEILLKMEDADVSSLSEIEKVSFVFTYYSEKKNTYVTLKPKNVKFK